jgi:hypothetical protein
VEIEGCLGRGFAIQRETFSSYPVDITHCSTGPHEFAPHVAEVAEQ